MSHYSSTNWPSFIFIFGSPKIRLCKLVFVHAMEEIPRMAVLVFIFGSPKLGLCKVCHEWMLPNRYQGWPSFIFIFGSPKIGLCKVCH